MIGDIDDLLLPQSKNKKIKHYVLIASILLVIIGIIVLIIILTKGNKEENEDKNLEYYGTEILCKYNVESEKEEVQIINEKKSMNFIY